MGWSMPRGPNGQSRPGDVIGAAIMVAKIATGEIEEFQDGEPSLKAEGGASAG